ncbi:MAG: hypothetical protein ACXWJK_08345, partial [Burkholderiaceae bacterium]
SNPGMNTSTNVQSPPLADTLTEAAETSSEEDSLSLNNADSPHPASQIRLEDANDPYSQLVISLLLALHGEEVLSTKNGCIEIVSGKESLVNSMVAELFDAIKKGTIYQVFNKAYDAQHEKNKWMTEALVQKNLLENRPDATLSAENQPKSQSVLLKLVTPENSIDVATSIRATNENRQFNRRTANLIAICSSLLDMLDNSKFSLLTKEIIETKMNRIEKFVQNQLNISTSPPLETAESLKPQFLNLEDDLFESLYTLVENIIGDYVWRYRTEDRNFIELAQVAKYIKENSNVADSPSTWKRKLHEILLPFAKTKRINQLIHPPYKAAKTQSKKDGNLVYENALTAYEVVTDALLYIAQSRLSDDAYTAYYNERKDLKNKHKSPTANPKILSAMLNRQRCLELDKDMLQYLQKLIDALIPKYAESMPTILNGYEDKHSTYSYWEKLQKITSSLNEKITSSLNALKAYEAVSAVMMLMAEDNLSTEDYKILDGELIALKEKHKSPKADFDKEMLQYLQKLINALFPKYADNLKEILNSFEDEHSKYPYWEKLQEITSALQENDAK